MIVLHFNVSESVTWQWTRTESIFKSKCIGTYEDTIWNFQGCQYAFNISESFYVLSLSKGIVQLWFAGLKIIYFYASEYTFIQTGQVVLRGKLTQISVISNFV